MPSSPAAQLADRILRAAQKAQSEEDLKIAVESALEKALSTLGIQSTPEYEKRCRSGFQPDDGSCLSMARRLRARVQLLR